MTECEHMYELMSEKLDGTIDPPHDALLARHLASCPDCAELFALMSGAHSALDFEVEPPEELLTGVMAGVGNIRRARRAARRRYIGLGVGLAAAAVLAVAIFPMTLRAGTAAPEDNAGVPSLYALAPQDAPVPREAAPEAPEAYTGDNIPGGDDASQQPAVCIAPEPEDGANMPIPEPAAPEEPAAPVEPADDELVLVTDFIPDIYVDLKYATQDNFTGQVIYDFTDARLRFGTVKKLMDVQDELRAQGLSLKIWDAYRPVSAQFTLWDVCPDPRYVADPNSGFSGHSCGGAVDVTLVTSDGAEVEMPTGFDDFTALADRDYSDATDTAAANARLLEDVMSSHGFAPYSAEWWHFSDTDPYPPAE